MPYKTNSDLPEALRDYPERAQTIWREAFNAAKASGKYSEEQCFKISWSALKQKYKIKGR